jgi:hypothetical protein
LQPTTRQLSLEASHERLGRSAAAPVVGSGTPDIRNPAGAQPWLTLSDGGNLFHPIAITP